MTGKRKRKITPIGANTHCSVDNVITLYRSSNDIFNGVLDYIFFKVLNSDPVQYHNINRDDTELTSEDIAEMQSDFENYESKYKKEISPTLEREIEEIIIYIRREALKEKVIAPFSKDKYQENKLSYSFTYLIKKIMDYYKEN